MREKILCVDDDPNILHAYQRALRKWLDIETALGERKPSSPSSNEVLMPSSWPI